MEWTEIRDLAPEELQQEEKKLRKELFSLRFQIMSGRVDNPMRVKQVRREIARIKTVFRQKELEDNNGREG